MHFLHFSPSMFHKQTIPIYTLHATQKYKLMFGSCGFNSIFAARTNN